MRRDEKEGNWVVVICNFTPVSHGNYRIGVPVEGFYTEVFNSDSSRYGGSNQGNLGGKFADDWGMHGYGQSLELCLPPLTVLVFKHDATKKKDTAIHEVAAISG